MATSLDVSRLSTPCYRRKFSPKSARQVGSRRHIRLLNTSDACAVTDSGYAAAERQPIFLHFLCLKESLGSLKARFAFSYFSCSQEENSEKGTVWRGKQARILFNTATRPSSVFKPLCRIIAFLLFSRKSLRKGRIPRQKLFSKEPIFSCSRKPAKFERPYCCMGHQDAWQGKHRLSWI